MEQCDWSECYKHGTNLLILFVIVRDLAQQLGNAHAPNKSLKGKDRPWAQYKVKIAPLDDAALRCARADLDHIVTTLYLTISPRCSQFSMIECEEAVSKLCNTANFCSSMALVERNI